MKAQINCSCKESIKLCFKLLKVYAILAIKFK